MIPREQIDEILDKADIVDVISEYVELKRRGAGFLGRCPFHNEKTPSFSVSREKNIYHCFGCHAHGNVIGFIMQYENVGYVDAIKILAEKVGVTITDEKRAYDDTNDKLREINRLAGIYYFKKLRSETGKTAYNYLRVRGLTNDIINKFGLGYAPYSRNELYTYLKKFGYNDELIKKSGLFSYYEGKFVDKFFNRVMYPIMDKNGKVVAFGGRSLDNKGAKYLNSPETEIFHKKNIIYGLNIAKKSRNDYFILCEGYMDVIAMHQAGFDMAIATMGTAFNISHALEIKKFNSKVFMLYDSDNAGQTATVKAAKILVNNGISVKVVDISPYKDPDECIKKEGAKFIVKALSNAIPEIYFRIEKTKDKYDLYDPILKLEFIKEVGQILSDYNDDYISVSYKDISKRYLIDEDLLHKNIKMAKLGHDFEIQREENLLKKNKKQRNLGNKIEKTILWFLFRKNIYDRIRKYIDEDYFEDEKFINILNKIDENFAKGVEAEEYKILSWFDNEKDIELIEEVYHCNDDAMSLTEYEYEKQINQTVYRLIEEYYDKEISKSQDFDNITKLINDKNMKLDNLEISLI